MTKCTPRIFLNVLMGVLLLIIGSHQAALAQSSGKAVPIRIAWQPDPNVPFYLARNKQLFESVGLAPEHLKFLAAPPMFAALQSKSVDIADMGLGPAIIAKSQGIDIKLVAVAVDVSGSNALIVQNNLKVNSATDLKNLRVGAQRGTTPYVGLVLYLEQSKMTLADIQFIDLNAPSIVPAFMKGEIDAAWVWSPWQNMLIQGGGKRVTTNKSVGALAPQVWAVRTEWAKSNPEAVQKFLSAIDMATRQIEAARDVAVEQLVLNLNIDKAVSAEVMKDSEFPNMSQQGAENYLLTPLSTDASGLKAAVKRTADFLFAQGIIKNKVDANDLVDSEPLRNYLGTKK